MDLRKFRAKTEKQLTAIVKKTALDLYRMVVYKTPFDTGRARGNWLIAVGRIPEGTTDRTLKRPATAEALATLAQYQANDETSIFLANNLDYIDALEHGHSKTQAPHGMVRLTVMEFGEFVKSAAGGGS